jgi:site-specific DNA-methyltransferase (adenine-specific)
LVVAEAPNTLYYGDNLDVLRRHVDDESGRPRVPGSAVQLGAQLQRALRRAPRRPKAAAQIRAFEDTWEWDESAAAAYHEVVEAGGKVSEVMQAFRLLLGDSDMLAYLAMMAPRLVELRAFSSRPARCTCIAIRRRVTTSRCCSTRCSGPQRFRTEIVWKRTQRHGNVSRNYGSICDVLLFYTKTEQYTWNQQYTAFDADYIEERFTGRDASGRRWQSVTLRNPGVRPNLHYPYTASDGVTYAPHPNGWSCDRDRMDRYDREGRLQFPAKPGGQLRLKMYLDESPGVKLQNLWEDIPPINSQAAERLGYPTQKPLALLDRIIATSSSVGDVVLDPFCGCGTAVASAQQLSRRWIGIDITHIAINLIKKRLADAHPLGVAYTVVGEPTTVDDAEQLAREDPYQFQWWALGLVGARPVDEKKGADRGIDGRLYFHGATAKGKTDQIILSVKGGHVTSSQVRDLRGVIEREKAAIGVLISFEEPTSAMRKEAAGGGFFETPWGKHPRLQLLTIAELLDGRLIDYPRVTNANQTFKAGPRAKRAVDKPASLFDPQE